MTLFFEQQDWKSSGEYMIGQTNTNWTETLVALSNQSQRNRGKVETRETKYNKNTSPDAIKNNYKNKKGTELRIKRSDARRRADKNQTTWKNNASNMKTIN